MSSPYSSMYKNISGQKPTPIQQTGSKIINSTISPSPSIRISSPIKRNNDIEKLTSYENKFGLPSRITSSKNTDAVSSIKNPLLMNNSAVYTSNRVASPYKRVESPHLKKEAQEESKEKLSPLKKHTSHFFKKPEKGIIGLKNLGNTCYLNSVL